MDEYEFEVDDDCDIDYDDTNGFKLHLVDHKVRTAKKDYKCGNCGVKIAANTNYMDFATKYMRTRFCVECGKYITGEE